MLELRLCLGARLLPFNCAGKQQSASAMRHVRCADCRITTVTGSAVAWDPTIPVIVLPVVHGMCNGKRTRKFDVSTHISVSVFIG